MRCAPAATKLPTSATDSSVAVLPVLLLAHSRGQVVVRAATTHFLLLARLPLTVPEALFLRRCNTIVLLVLSNPFPAGSLILLLLW